jgi:hypothetical protein
LWFGEFHWLFKENKNTREGFYPAWESVTFRDSFTFCISCILAIIFIILIAVTYTIGFAVVGGSIGLIFVLCIISALLMKSIISDGTSIMQPYGILKTFKDLLFSKLNYVMIIVSIVMILLAFSNLGMGSGIFAVIAIVILFGGFIANNIYHREIPTDSTQGLINEETDQAKKICKKITDKIQSGGGEVLLSTLKKLSKQLQNKQLQNLF